MVKTVCMSKGEQEEGESLSLLVASVEVRTEAWMMTVRMMLV